MDERMENVNMWTKGLLLHADEESWQKHSPNVMAAKQCAVFEEEQYVRHLNDKDKYRDRMKHGTSVPKSMNERSRLYEWMIHMFDNKLPNRILRLKDSDAVVKQSTVNKKDELNKCFEAILVLDSSSAHNDEDGEDLNNLFDNNNDDRLNEDENEASRDAAGITTSILHKLATVDVVLSCENKLKEKNILEIRNRRLKRLKRSENYERQMYLSLLQKQSEVELKLERIKCSYQNQYNVRF